MTEIEMNIDLWEDQHLQILKLQNKAVHDKEKESIENQTINTPNLKKYCLQLLKATHINLN